MKPGLWWLDRPGLAGGIDKSGERATELLGLGFGSVEFGSATVRPLPGGNPGLDALLAGLNAAWRRDLPATAVGVGLGLPPELPPDELASEWQSGLERLADAPFRPDYLSLNLSAATNRRFTIPEWRPVLHSALIAVARFYDAHSPSLPVLAIKLPVEAIPGLWPLLVAAGVRQVTAVLPERADAVARLAEVGALCGKGGPAIVAVGGICDAAGRRAALAAGASEIQVHRLFLAAGATTPALLQDEPDDLSPENHERRLALSCMPANSRKGRLPS